MARKYSNTFAETTLTGSISNSAVTIQIGSTAGLPASFPYTLAIDYGTSSVEMVTVTALAGSNLTVTRGVDGTSAQSHTAGARVVHPVGARDLSEPQVHIDGTADIHGLSGGATVVGTTSAQTLTNKTISAAANSITNIPSSSIVAVAASKISQPFASMNVVGANGGAQAVTVTGDEAVRTTPIGSWKRGGVGLVVGEAGVVEATSDLSIDTQRAAGAAALLARLYIKATAKIGAIIQRVAGQTQDLLAIQTEAGANLFRVQSDGSVGTVSTVTATGNIVSGAALNGATLATTGNATVGGTLGVTGLLTASNGVFVNAGNLTVSGNATINGTLSAPGMATVSSRDNTARTTTSAAFTSTLTPATICGVTFIAPASGKVEVAVSCDVTASGASPAFACASPAVRQGGTIGSGTPVLTAAFDYSVIGYGGGTRGGVVTQVSGLTPGANYNACFEHVSSVGTATFRWREIIVRPCLA